MLKVFFGLLALFGIGLGVPASASTVVLKFDEFAVPEVLPVDVYLGEGVLFDQELLTFTGGGFSPDGSVAVNGLDAAPFDLSKAISGSFTSAVGFVGVFAGNVFFGEVKLSVFDAGGTLLGEDSFIRGAAGAPDPAGSLAVKAEGIASFKIATAGRVTIDNLTYSPKPFAPVPVPAGLPLMLTGLLCIAAISRRRRNG